MLPPPVPDGWQFFVKVGPVPRKAEVYIDKPARRADITLDEVIFNDPNVPVGIKVFMLWHEKGHVIFGSREDLCDRFAFLHALSEGVTPFLCYMALALYMPEHYQYRVDALYNFILDNPQLQTLVNDEC